MNMGPWFDEDGTRLYQCNDCGILLCLDWELCSPCQRYYEDDDERGGHR